jgi:hypothetical protein
MDHFWGLWRWKVKVYLFYVMEAQLHTFLTSALDGVGGQRHAMATLSVGSSSGTRCARSWVGVEMRLKDFPIFGYRFSLAVYY